MQLPDMLHLRLAALPMLGVATALSAQEPTPICPAGRALAPTVDPTIGAPLPRCRPVVTAPTLLSSQKSKRSNALGFSAHARSRGLRILASEGRRSAELLRLRHGDRNLSGAAFYHGVWLREAAISDSVVFDLWPFVAAPRTAGGLALGYSEGLGGRMWAGGRERDPLRAALRGSAARALAKVWAALAPRPPAAISQRLLLPGLRLRLGSEALHHFGTDGREAPAPDSRVVMVYAGYEAELARGWHVSIGAEGFSWRAPGVADRHAAGATARIGGAGRRGERLLVAEGTWTGAYRRAALEAALPVRVGRFDLRPAVRLGWGERLPFAAGFWLGGGEGFPGLRGGEERGDREIMASLGASRALAGPVSLHLMAAFGRSAIGGPLLAGPGWLAGVRGGLGLRTPAGLLRLEYGGATGGRRAVFIRLGHWL
jgi:hypothetical protein